MPFIRTRERITVDNMRPSCSINYAIKRYVRTLMLIMYIMLTCYSLRTIEL